MGSVTVYIAEWELACCGAPIAVGEPAVWSLIDRVDTAWIETLAGSEVASTVSRSYSHHGEPDEGVETRGIVRSIHAVFCEFGPRPDLGPGYYPIAGSGRVVPVTAVGNRGSGLVCRPAGYVAELETV